MVGGVCNPNGARHATCQGSWSERARLPSGQESDDEFSRSPSQGRRSRPRLQSPGASLDHSRNAAEAPVSAAYDLWDDYTDHQIFLHVSLHMILTRQKKKKHQDPSLEPNFTRMTQVQMRSRGCQCSSTERKYISRPTELTMIFLVVRALCKCSRLQELIDF